MEISMNGLSLNLISHPGETLAELLEINSMTQKELSVRLSCTPKHINEIIKGLKPISNALAVKLENVFNLKASFWNNLQNIHDEQIEKLRIKESVSHEEIQYFKDNKSIYKFLVGDNWVEECSDVTEGVLNLRKFLKINSLLQVGKLLQVNGAYRMNDKLKVNDADDVSPNDVIRLRQSVDKAMTQGNGVIMITTINEEKNEVRYFSRNLMCPVTGLSYVEPAPHSFSFNSPSGWCPRCKGLGKVRSERLKVKSERDEVDAIIRDEENWFEKLVDYPVEDETDSDEVWSVCPECGGKRLNKEALSYKFAGKTIAELSEMDIEELLAFLEGPLELNTKQRAVSEPILKEICARLRFMQSVGLTYLSLGRSSESLSGGESQRIRLATQIGSRLVNVLYILDEPSIGLHQRDNRRLIDSLKELRDMGNSVIVVEHDEQIMREADYIVDIGPKAGRLGGKIMFEGTPEELLRSDTITAQWLRGERKITLPCNTDTPKDWICVKGCHGNNLKHIDVAFPLGKMIGITGVSGSGKSTLVNQTLYPILSQHLYRSLTKPLAYDSIEGIDLIDKVIAVDQSPIGRTPRSNPATYTNVFNDIRELFAQLPEARIRAWKAGRFSFNMKGGRCENCLGNGYRTIQMHFLPDVYVPCEVCGGKRYNKETLEVKFKGKTISDVLDMTVNQAVEFFESQPYILKKIKTIQEVGLGYIKLGQSSTTLSGGESQRIKLAAELGRPSTGKTVYILDEPTTGLHFEDVHILLGVLRKLVDRGNTVIIIEHNLDVIRACDWLIDLGPEGGREGGKLVVAGSIEDVRNCKESITGQYL